jgi:cardiolipin synthase A/B
VTDPRLPSPSIPAERRDVLPAPVGPSFARGLWRIASADVSSGNSVQLLADGPATFDAMIEMIGAARESVALESYIFRSDGVGRRFGDALLAAAGRGVHVRLIIDWIGARGTSRGFLRDLRAGGVELQVFNPIGFRAWLGLLPRDHRKLLVCDGQVGITGGVGIGDEWMIRSADGRRSRWRDTSVRIAGPAAADMLAAFESMWGRATGKERRGSHRRVRRMARGSHLDPRIDAPALVGIVEGEPMRMRVARALQIQAISAERSIWIATAYFVPSPAEVEALTGAARDGVDVRLLLPGRSDHSWVTPLARRFYRRLLANGVRIWEWRGAMMHGKWSVVDGEWVRIGSTDFNPLGVALNYELDAVIEDTRFGGEAESMFLADLDHSREILRG